MKQDMIVILDLGSEENSALARKIRSFGVYSEIHPHDLDKKGFSALANVKGIILYGGKNNVVDGVEIDVNPEIYDMGIPVVAIDHKKAKCPTITEKDVESFLFDTCPRHVTAH